MFLKLYKQESPGALVKNVDCDSVGLAGAWDSAFFNKLSVEADIAGVRPYFK